MTEIERTNRSIAIQLYAAGLLSVLSVAALLVPYVWLIGALLAAAGIFAASVAVGVASTRSREWLLGGLVIWVFAGCVFVLHIVVLAVLQWITYQEEIQYRQDLLNYEVELSEL